MLMDDDQIIKDKRKTYRYAKENDTFIKEWVLKILRGRWLVQRKYPLRKKSKIICEKISKQIYLYTNEFRIYYNPPIIKSFKVILILNTIKFR